MDNYLFSIIIPTYNRTEILKRTLLSLARQTVSPALYEVIVVNDNPSTEVWLELELLQLPYQLTVIDNMGTHGPATARNLGFALSHAPICSFIGDDTIPDSQFIFQHLLWHKRYEHIPQRAVQGFVEWHRESNPDDFMLWLTCQQNENWEGGGMQFNWGALRDGDKWKEQAPGWALTSNVSITREIFESEGGFCEEFPSAAWEDIEIGYRMALRGIPTYFNPNAVVYHLHTQTLDTFLARQLKEGESRLIYAKQHPEVAPAYVNPENLRNFTEDLFSQSIKLARETHYLQGDDIKPIRNQRWGIALQMASIKGILDGIGKRGGVWEALKHVHTGEQIMHVVGCAGSLERGDTAMAQMEANWLLDKNADNWAVYCVLAEVYRAMDNRAEAIAQATKASEIGMGEKWPKQLLAGLLR